MKNLFCFLVVFVILHFNKNVIAQGTMERFDFESEMFKPGADFYDIVKRGTEFYQLHPDAEEDGPSQEFYRWVALWQNRVNVPGAHGDFNRASYAYERAILDPICNGSLNVPSQWSIIGPAGQTSFSAPVNNYQTIGRVDAVAALPTEPNIVYAGSSNGGLFRTDLNIQPNGVPVWTNITDQSHMPAAGVEDIIIDPDINGGGYHTLYITYGQQRFNYYGIGVMKSVDNGQTWQLTGLNPTTMGGFVNIRRLLLHPTNHQVLYALSNTEVYKTTDGASNWSALGLKNHLSANTLPDEDAYDIELNPLNDNIVYVGGNSLWRYDPSLPVNQRWVDINSSLSSMPSSGERIKLCSVSIGTVHNLYVLYMNGSIHNIDKSTNGGYAWTLVAHPVRSSQTTTGHYFVVSPADQNIVYIADDPGGTGNRRVNKSVDGGQNFYAVTNYFASNLYYGVSTHADVGAFELIQGSSAGNGVDDFLIEGNDGGILYSTSSYMSGSTPVVNWQNINGTGLSITQFWGFGGTESDKDFLVGGTQDNQIMRYYHGSWTLNGSCDDYEMAFDENNLVPGQEVIYGQVECAWDNLSLIKSATGGMNFSAPISQTLQQGNYRQPMKAVKENSQFYVGYHDLFQGNTPSPVLNIPAANKTKFRANYNVPSCWSVNAFDVVKPIGLPEVIYVSKGSPTWNYDLPTCDLDCQPISNCTIPPCDHNNCNCCPCPSGDCLLMKVLWKSIDGGNTWVDKTDIGNDGVDDLEAARWAPVSGIAMNPDNTDEVYVTFGGIWDDPPQSGIGKFRVMRSLDGGNTWSDYSQGLREFPVNAIVFQKGANAIYIATDVGVFYRKTDDPGSQWECFNKDLPICTVLDLQINYCAQLIRAASHGRGIWESPLAPSNVVETVSGTPTWSADRNLLTDLRIQTGATLTITSCTINIAAGKKIIVDPGAYLVLNGCTLTNGCGAMWKGIEVRSNQTASQYGRVTVSNSSVIENAVDAIRTWNPGDYNSTGGVIFCSNSTFINNKRSVEFAPYPNANGSFFTNTTFTVDDQFRDGNNFFAHVTLNGVKGISFRRCTFANAQTNVPSSNLLGYGISSLDANFTVGATCASIPPPFTPCPAADVQPSIFRGLLYGVYATNSASNRNFIVDQSNFENNMVGVYSRAVAGAVITRCSLTIGNNLAPMTPIDVQTGIMVNTGSGYRVEDNYLIKDNSTPSTIYPIGIWIINTGGAPNQVFNNELHELVDACISTGTNRSADALTGLQFRCNTMVGTSFLDIAVVKNNASSLVDGIRHFQGDPSFPTGAGNEFSCNGVSEGCIYNHSGSFIEYLFHASYCPVEPPTLSFDPLWVSTNGPMPIPPSCTSNFSNGHDYPLSSAMIIQLRDDYNNDESAYLNVLYNYKQLIDNGNTNALLEEMEISWSSDAWTLRNELIALSPYLSEDVLRRAALTGVLPDAMMLEICLANPDATRSDAFIKFLEYEIPNPLPVYMTDMIMATWSGSTPRTLLEGSLASYGEKMAFEGDMLLTNYLLEADKDHVSEIRYWLDRIQTLAAKYALCEDYFQQDGKLTDAENVLNSIPDDFTLKGTDLDQYNRYVEYFNFRKDIINSGRNLMQMTEGEIATLEAFANATNDLPGIMAQNLLCFAYNICKESNLELPGEGNGGGRMASPFNGNAKSFYNEVTVTPNPAVDYAAFMYDLPIMEKQATLSITDLTGRVVQEFTLGDKKGQVIWDTRTVTKGVYLYHIKGDYSEQTHGKILVNKY